MSAQSAREAVRADHAAREAEAMGRLERAEARDRALATARLGAAVAGLLALFVGLRAGAGAAWWALTPAALFVGLVVAHDRATRAADRARREAAHWQAALRRVNGTWPGTGRAGARFRDPRHPYAEDLDLFGRGSLFELLCTARTAAGEECLAGWLRAPAPPDEVRRRQQAVADLRDRAALRAAIALAGDAARQEPGPSDVEAWADAPPLLPAGMARAAAWAASVVGLTGLIAWLSGVGAWALGAGTLVAIGVTGALARGVRGVLGPLDEAAREIGALAAMLECLADETFRAPLLADLQRELVTGSRAATGRARRLLALKQWLDAQRNLLFAPLAALVLWRVHVAFAVERWRRENGPGVAGWRRAGGSIEALCALAAYAGENPDDAFPTLVDGAPRLEARGLAHPLIVQERAVRNDVALGGGTRLLVVSGSNMSGKSTLLRAVGANAVLAQAGAPVRAREMRLTPLEIGASIRTVDSLQAGVSRFYAEILRLRDVAALAESAPTLFLLDEILHGTNSHDRRIGAEAVARVLLRAGAIGMLTTHDLALADLAADPALAAANSHFGDRVVEDRLVFDYLLRPGAVRGSNAIALMRAIGLLQANA